MTKRALLSLCIPASFSSLGSTPPKTRSLRFDLMDQDAWWHLVKAASSRASNEVSKLTDSGQEFNRKYPCMGWPARNAGSLKNARRHLSQAVRLNSAVRSHFGADDAAVIDSLIRTDSQLTGLMRLPETQAPSIP